MMQPTNTDPTPLSDAAVTIGEMLTAAQTARADSAEINRLRAVLEAVIGAAKEIGRLTRYAERMEQRNSTLIHRLSTAHADREQLVRDLAPALAVITEVFNTARAQRDLLAPSSTPFVPARTQLDCSAVDGYRAEPVEAHPGD